MLRIEKQDDNMCKNAIMLLENYISVPVIYQESHCYNNVISIAQKMKISIYM